MPLKLIDDLNIFDKKQGDLDLEDDTGVFTFDPEGEGYDYETAKQYGLEPDETGHWPSRVPQTGLLLKGRKHKTWSLTEKGEREAGYKITQKDGRYYSTKPTGNLKLEDDIGAFEPIKFQSSFLDWIKQGFPLEVKGETGTYKVPTAPSVAKAAQQYRQFSEQTPFGRYLTQPVAEGELPRAGQDVQSLAGVVLIATIGTQAAQALFSHPRTQLALSKIATNPQFQKIPKQTLYNIMQKVHRPETYGKFTPEELKIWNDVGREAGRLTDAYKVGGIERGVTIRPGFGWLARMMKVAPSAPVKTTGRPTRPTAPQALAPIAGGKTHQFPAKLLEKGVSVIGRDPGIRMEKNTQVKDIHGNKVTLPKGEEYTPFKLSNNQVWLHDGKNVVVNKNQLKNVKGQGVEIKKPMIKPEEPMPPAPPKEPPPTVMPKGAEGPEGEGRDVATAYETQKDIWFGKKDVRVFLSTTEKARLQTELRTALNKPVYDEDVKNYDRAIQLYIDTKRNPEHLAKYYEKLSSEQKKIAALSQNLPANVKAIADKIADSYTAIGLEAQEAEVIKNVLDNYVGRTWDLTDKQKTQLFRKFGTTTRHAKARVLETILEGWSKGYKLKVEGATNNLQILKEEMVKTIEDKRFLKALQKIKTADGEPLLTTKQLEGYVRVEHPNFKTWKWAGKAEEGKFYGKNAFIDKEGNLYERRELYAPKKQAKNLNNILGVSKLKGLPGINEITKANAVVKAWILQSSFFHHLAFSRSYWFGTNHKRWNEMSIRQAYRQGIKSIEEESPIILLGIKNGLTLGLKQDWNEEILREEGFISRILDKTKATKAVKDKIMGLRQAQADFLFGKFGAGLKAKAFTIEYRNMTKKHPDKSPDEIAKMVANLINDDFGGLHLQRIGRNPTIQHIFRLFALAPDWTESNVRTMLKAVKSGGKSETEFYRKFWAGILTKGAILTVLGNALTAGLGEDDKDAKGAWQRMLRNYKTAWREGHMRWMDIDITAIYKMLGGKKDNRKYFSVLGHFKDPVKFITHPIRSLQHKGSVIYRFFHEALSGVDWAGRRFTTTAELLGLDEKGKKKGKAVTWDFKGRGPISYEQIPSFLLSQVKGMQPIQIQNLLSWTAGEMEGFDALLKSAGLRVSTAYREDKGKKRGLSARYDKKSKKKPVGLGARYH